MLPGLRSSSPVVYCSAPPLDLLFDRVLRFCSQLPHGRCRVQRRRRKAVLFHRPHPWGGTDVPEHWVWQFSMHPVRRLGRARGCMLRLVLVQGPQAH